MKKYMLCAALSCLMPGFGSEANAAHAASKTEASKVAEAFEIPVMNDPLESCDTTAYCFQKDQCNDTNCQNAIVACHQLTELEFNTMLGYYAATPHFLGAHSVSSIRSLVNGLECAANDHISFNDASGQITFTVVTGTPFSSGTGRYSAAFLRGVLRLYNPASSDVFKFYRVKDAYGHQSVGMKLVKNGVDVYFSDMTDVYP
jgi:hypothetical protein